MARDLPDDAARPVTVKAPPRPLGMWGAFRAARRNVLELIPEPAYREPMLASGAGRAPSGTHRSSPCKASAP